MSVNEEVQTTTSGESITVTFTGATDKLRTLFFDHLADNSAEATTPWEGVLAIEGSPTSDMRYLIPGEIGQRDLPLPLNVQTVTGDGHEGAANAGRIDTIVHIPMKDFAFKDEFNLDGVPDTATVIWATGVFDGSDAAIEAERMITNGADVSIDIPTDRLAVIDPDTLEEVPEDQIDMADVLSGKYLTGIAGKIAGATIVGIGAFEQARIQLSDGQAVVASAAQLRIRPVPVPGESAAEAARIMQTLVAAAAPLKPPAEWFDNPRLTRLTPLTITDDGRVYGHLADWDGCHTGFSTVCVPPFRSESDYAYFNVGEIDCADGTKVAVGKLMFSRDEGVGHAPTDPNWGVKEASKHYDDATKIGGFVRAGADRFGTWLAGAMRSDLSEEDLQIIRANPPSGDWRPIPGKGSELVAAFCVPVPGFPIPRMMVASGEVGLTIITGPLVVERGPRETMRKMQMLKDRLHVTMAAAGMRDFWLESEEFADITADQRKRWAKSGVALPDGSFPIVKCSGDGPSAVNARRAIGRAPESKRGRVRSHIAKREKALGCSTD